MDWEIVIGLETHAQLSTRSKIFSGASTAFGAPPNTQACAIDLALPGTLPVLNKGAVERAIRFGLAVGATINRRSVFERKNYFYPDLPKGYQISQYQIPIVQGGSLTIQVGDREKTIRLTRAHLEEDAGKSLHEDFHGMSGIDLNRAGTPLLEIVSEPDMRSAEEAVAYAKKLHEWVQWFDICDGNMEEGSFRCDANVSVRRPGAPLGTRREIKNLNSFRFLQQAIEYEAKWQIETLRDGGRIEQATVLFDPDTGETRVMRTKEDAHDYRYFPDPDLLPLLIADEDIERVRSTMQKHPEKQRQDFEASGIPSHVASVLMANPTGKARIVAEVTEILERSDLSREKRAQLVSNTANSVVSSSAVVLENWRPSQSQLAQLPRYLVDIQLFVDAGKISSRQAKEVQDAVLAGEGSAEEVVKARGLEQLSDRRAIEKIVDEVLAANAQQVADYRQGKQKAFNSLVGQVMKATGGKANPAQVNEILKKRLA
jgi:aspartyl-tRNA(Asn)/glutamyl-tRNA(Gln) amidotransferase subunit B